ncbi:thioredoxin domain-containing protein [Rhodobacteraceae bacterium 2CG4]|uniref:Thioredoxin domain-containing protein n=1 Tax=Halovulum marinum TaxID=2662447 RepID=A0A6L5Z0C7_9RHOB|nr:DsbA family oxidoreductase [Halovulum marinum]MSU89948.1 thioredoxin domain-containing protein [Halovulum marinum]
MTTTLDIISDPICPWCHIGKVRLDRALEARPDHPFEIRWLPFQLNPEMPRAGMERAAYLEAKFGGRERAAQVYAHVAREARASGLEIDFDAIPRTPNTLDAHRLLHWAGIEGRQTLAANQLFHRYFLKGQDIGDAAVLADVARTVGMDAEVTARLLLGDADLAEVRALDARAREMGVTGVPTFVIGGTYAVTGAQDTGTWLKIIDELVEKTHELQNTARSGQGS